MKSRFLFPGYCRYIGYLLGIPGFVLGYFVLYQNYEIPGFVLRLRATDTLFLKALENFTNELALTLVIVGLLLVAFSKVKQEDELTGKIRLNALYWAILVNYGFYLLFTILMFVPSSNQHSGFGFFDNYLDFTIYNLFVPLLIFILRFYYLLYQNKNEYNIKAVRYLTNKPYRFIGKWLSIIIICFLIVNRVFPLKVNFLESTFIVLPISLLIWAYSKEKTEDEYINATRLEAMQVAVYVNYVILLVSNILFYSSDFLEIQLLNLITIPLIFIVWFQYKLHSTNNESHLKKTTTLAL
ncbi:hypothetical protein BDD43_1348 [Mucilaginibacter gracilis]|uniref:Uncharacterized protein n=1 Tax=Mucilaginibacter gracilis TaxID=423350 RepID=A0A495IXI1_9SPHI|nr:hypothetical protein [Mucilaginibacter gracilis]RKR81203.1 hypothetical protein BDD43_1348 [Mucilaginibacter gracilis]